MIDLFKESDFELITNSKHQNERIVKQANKKLDAYLKSGFVRLGLISGLPLQATPEAAPTDTHKMYYFLEELNRGKKCCRDTYHSAITSNFCIICGDSLEGFGE